MEKDLSYTWYMRIYTKYRDKYTVRKAYIRDMIVYTKYINATYKTGPDDKTYSFFFFSTFEVLDLPIKGPMEDGPPYPPFSGWKLNSNDPSHVQQAQVFRLPVWLCRRSSF
jgi:hypothetical protein